MAAATGRPQPESAARTAQEQPGDVVRAELPAALPSAREARAVVRQALTAWGIEDPDGDSELLVSEVVANAAEHGGGPIRLSLRRDPEDPAGIRCEVTDTSPVVPRQREAGPGEERGRGLAIVSALATESGVRATEAGKTSWFTLALGDRIQHAPRQPEPEPARDAGFEAGFEAGA